MKDQTLKKFLERLAESFFIFAPRQTVSGLKIGEVSDLATIDWSGEMPRNSWKELLVPHEERLLERVKGRLATASTKQPPLACVGVNVIDLKALTLLDQVFGRDIYYQARRRQLLIVGYSGGLPDDYRRYKVFSHNYQEDILEHLIFDIFIEKRRGGKIKFYSGSAKGQDILTGSGVSDFENIEFAGVVPEAGPDKRLEQLAAAVTRSSGQRLWDELDRICLACGKCSSVCPTCFCFDLVDQTDPQSAGRSRRWGSCFFNDFSLVAGPKKDLDSIKKKIYFWYTHKFVRIPHEYSLPGCVSCGRCVKACPVGIDVLKNIKKLTKIK